MPNYYTLSNAADTATCLNDLLLNILSFYDVIFSMNIHILLLS